VNLSVFGGKLRRLSLNVSVTIVMIVMTMLLLISACGPEPTPRPVDIPTNSMPEITPTALAGRDNSLRYVLMPNTVNAVPDLQLIESASQVIQLYEDTTAIPLYDIAVMYGLEEGWTVSEYKPTMSLVINAENRLFENPAVLTLLQQSIDARQVVEQLLINGTEPMTTAAREPNFLRTSLANLGFPDGVVVSLGIGYVPGAAAVMDQMKAANLGVKSTLMYTNAVREALANGTIQAALVFWTMSIERDGWVQRYGAENVIDLYSVPISYKVNPDWSVGLTPNGFPLPMAVSASRAFDTVEMNTSSGG
jgi:hypothetical protein